MTDAIARPLTVVGYKALREVNGVLERLRCMLADAGPDERPLIVGRIDEALDRRNEITRARA